MSTRSPTYMSMFQSQSGEHFKDQQYFSQFNISYNARNDRDIWKFCNQYIKGVKGQLIDDMLELFLDSYSEWNVAFWRIDQVIDELLQDSVSYVKQSVDPEAGQTFDYMRMLSITRSPFRLDFTKALQNLVVSPGTLDLSDFPVDVQQFDSQQIDMSARLSKLFGVKYMKDFEGSEVIEPISATNQAPLVIIKMNTKFNVYGTPVDTLQISKIVLKAIAQKYQLDRNSTTLLLEKVNSVNNTIRNFMLLFYPLSNSTVDITDRSFTTNTVKDAIKVVWQYFFNLDVICDTPLFKLLMIPYYVSIGAIPYYTSYRALDDLIYIFPRTGEVLDHTQKSIQFRSMYGTRSRFRISDFQQCGSDQGSSAFYQKLLQIRETYFWPPSRINEFNSYIDSIALAVYNSKYKHDSKSFPYIPQQQLLDMIEAKEKIQFNKDVEEIDNQVDAVLDEVFDIGDTQMSKQALEAKRRQAAQDIKDKKLNQVVDLSQKVARELNLPIIANQPVDNDFRYAIGYVNPDVPSHPITDKFGLKPVTQSLINEMRQGSRTGIITNLQKKSRKKRMSKIRQSRILFTDRKPGV